MVKVQRVQQYRLLVETEVSNGSIGNLRGARALRDLEIHVNVNTHLNNRVQLANWERRGI
jgi:hypothetical protein